MNWTKLITEVRAAGLTQSEIASFTRTSQGHISDIERGKKGARLTFDIGQRLLELHSIVSSQVEEIPPLQPTES